MSQRAGNNVDDDRRRQFQRQQDRLKMMAPQLEKNSVSADAMIDSLLQKSDTFRKVTNDLPVWLQADSVTCFPFYIQIWEFVKASDKMVDTQKISQLLLTGGLHPDILGYIWNLANKETPGQLNKQELFVVLALVGLAQSGCTFNSITVLNMVPSPPIPRLLVPFQPIIGAPPTLPSPNLNSPSVVPSLQTNYTYTQYQGVHPTMSLHSNVQATISTPQPRPTYNTSDNQESILGSLQGPASQVVSSFKETIDDDFDDFQCVAAPTNSQIPMRSSSVESTFGGTGQKLELNAPMQNSVSMGTTELDNFFSAQFENKNEPKNVESVDVKDVKVADDFSDFQSAYTCDASIVQPAKALPKLSSFIKVSPKSERKLRHLAKPESLKALPESKISSRNHVSAMPSISVVSVSRSVGSRLANHSLAKGEKIKHQFKVKPIMSTIPKSASVDEDMFPKCFKASSFILKETKIPSSEESELNAKDHELTRKIEIPSVGTFKETSLPVTKKPDIPSPAIPVINPEPENPAVIPEPELFAVNEDKYGALRDIELFRPEPDDLKEETVPPSSHSEVEDFGDFLSADLPSEKAAEAWSAWNSSVNVPENSETPPVPTAEKPEDPPSKFITDFSGISLDTLPPPKSSDMDLFSASLTDFGSLNFVNNAKDDEFSDFKMSEPQLSTSISLLSDLQQIAPQKQEPVVEAKTQPNYDIREFAEEDFGDFMTPTEDDIAVAVEDGISLHSSAPSYGISRNESFSSLDLQGKLSRKGSVPSLNLPNEDSPVAGRCLQCCFNLLKEAVDIFNGVSDKEVLTEVFQTDAARNYVKYLGVVYSIANRVSVNFGINIVMSHEISLLWKEIRSITSNYSPQAEEPATEDGSGAACIVCGGATTTADVERNGTKYHTACANLWINCIDTSLPCS